MHDDALKLDIFWQCDDTLVKIIRLRGWRKYIFILLQLDAGRGPSGHFVKSIGLKGSNIQKYFYNFCS